MRTNPIVALALLCGCGQSLETGPAGSDVRLTVQPQTVAAGDTVTLVLRNASDGAIGYNLCTSALERAADGDWRAVPEDRVCTLELRTLEPGDDARIELSLPPDLRPGTHRYVTNVERLGTGERFGVASESFRVEG